MVKAKKKVAVDILQQFHEVRITRCARQPQEDISRKQVATYAHIATPNLAKIPYLTSCLHSPIPHLRYVHKGRERT